MEINNIPDETAIQFISDDSIEEKEDEFYNLPYVLWGDFDDEYAIVAVSKKKDSPVVLHGIHRHGDTPQKKS